MTHMEQNTRCEISGFSSFDLPSITRNTGLPGHLIPPRSRYKGASSVLEAWNFPWHFSKVEWEVVGKENPKNKEKPKGLLPSMRVFFQFYVFGCLKMAPKSLVKKGIFDPLKIPMVGRFISFLRAKSQFSVVFRR